MKHDKPQAGDAELCVEYRKKAKRGDRLNRDELALCERMWRSYPEWYSAQEDRVFNETMPFGSDAFRTTRTPNETR